MSEYYLVHHGIKGQRWGIRRYQNEDGSLTDAGKKHYGIKSDGTISDRGRKHLGKALYKQKRKELSKAEKRDVGKTGKFISGALTGYAGANVGAYLGSIAGLSVGALPGMLGAVAGMTAGGWSGLIGGNYLGRAIYSRIRVSEIKKAVRSGERELPEWMMEIKVEDLLKKAGV